MATTKTNAVRLLERLGVPFGLRAYEVDPDDLAAETVARKVGLTPGRDDGPVLPPSAPPVREIAPGGPIDRRR